LPVSYAAHVVANELCRPCGCQ